MQSSLQRVSHPFRKPYRLAFSLKEKNVHIHKIVMVLIAFQIGHGSLFSQPCSLQILHEDETSTKAPPPPLAAFGSHKMTATQLRRARMMNKQMSEDITSRPSKHGHISLKHQVMTSEDRCRSSCDTRSLTKLSESCEMRDLSGRSIYDHRQKFFKQCSLQQYSDSEEV